MNCARDPLFPLTYILQTQCTIIILQTDSIFHKQDKPKFFLYFFPLKSLSIVNMFSCLRREIYMCVNSLIPKFFSMLKNDHE